MREYVSRWICPAPRHGIAFILMSSSWPGVWLSFYWCRILIFTLEYATAATAAAAAAKSLQSCLTLCDPIDCSPPGSLVPGILQGKTLEWVAVSFSKAWKWKVKVKSLSHVRPSATPWTAAFQASPSIGFSRQEYWSGVPLPSPRIGNRPYLKHYFFFFSQNTQSSLMFKNIWK